MILTSNVGSALPRGPGLGFADAGDAFHEAGVERAVSDAAGTEMHDWFERYVGGVEDLPWVQTLARAGLEVDVMHPAKLGAPPTYTLRDMPNATAEQRRVREGWLTGTSSGR